MAKEIEITARSFMNYTDCREKKEVCAVAAESIKNYAKSLSEEEMKIFLAEVSDEALVSETHYRMIVRKNKIDAIERYLQ